MGRRTTRSTWHQPDGRADPGQALEPVRRPPLPVQPGRPLRQSCHPGDSRRTIPTGGRGGSIRTPLAEVVATDSAQQRWITRDFGGVSGWDLPGVRTACLSTFATIQAGLVDSVDSLAAAGCPALTAESLAEAVDPLLARDDVWHDPSLPRCLTRQEWARFHRVAPRLKEYCRALGRGTIPPTLTHGDLEPLSVVRTDHGWLVHDWTYATVAHPFYDLACWLSDCDEVEAEAAVATYLNAWQPYASITELRREWAVAKPVGGFAELLKFVRLCDAIERGQWFSWTPMLFGWARRLLRFLEPGGTQRAGW